MTIIVLYIHTNTTVLTNTRTLNYNHSESFQFRKLIKTKTSISFRNLNMDEGMSGFCVKPRSSGGGGGGCGGGGGGGGGGGKCGRWNPTSEQVKVLTNLFRSGLRTPSTDQIQKISSQLSFYGKIESKNVFYWFQNHKARERQKRRRVYVEHDQNDNRNTNHEDNLPSTKQHCGEMNNQVLESERVIETLQLFPLNSFDYSDQCKENSSPYTTMYNCGTEMENHYHHHPPLDLRLSFL